MPARRDNARLTHRAAELVLEAPGSFDEVASAREHATHRGAEPLAEIDPDRIERSGILGGRGAARYDGVEQTGAVHVGREIVLPRHRRHLRHTRERPHRPAAEVGGVLDRQQARARMVPAGWTNGGVHLLTGEDAPNAVDGSGHRARERRGSPGLEVQRVAGPIEDDLVPRPTMNPVGDLVAHRA